MRRSFALITLIVSVAAVAVACGDDADPAVDVADTTTTSSTSTTTTTEPAGPPATFCEGVEQVNLLFDDIARTMLATMAGEPSAEFIVVLGRAVDLLDQAAALAPDEADDAIGLVADAYAGFEELLFEIDFVVSDLPVDDPRAAALSDSECPRVTTPPSAAPPSSCSAEERRLRSLAACALASLTASKDSSAKAMTMLRHTRTPKTYLPTRSEVVK